jgi:hypothetical protein
MTVHIGLLVFLPLQRLDLRRSVYASMLSIHSAKESFRILLISQNDIYDFIFWGSGSGVASRQAQALT